MKYNFENSISQLIKTSANLFLQLATQQHKNQVNNAYIPFLIQLWEKDGLTQAVLHKAIGIEQPTAVRTLDRMERDELIIRKKNPEDRRKIFIHLTDKAKMLQPSITAISKHINLTAQSGLNKEEIKTLTQLLNQVITNLKGNLK